MSKKSEVFLGIARKNIHNKNSIQMMMIVSISEKLVL